MRAASCGVAAAVDLEGQVVARPGGVLVGVHEAVAADPDLVLRVRQVRHHEASLVAGDDDLAERGLEVRRLGDDPDAGLAARVAPHDATDIAVAIGRRRRRASAGQPHDGDRRQHRSGQTDPGCHTHRTLLEQRLSIPRVNDHLPTVSPRRLRRRVPWSVRWSTPRPAQTSQRVPLGRASVTAIVARCRRARSSVGRVDLCSTLRVPCSDACGRRSRWLDRLNVADLAERLRRARGSLLAFAHRQQSAHLRSLAERSRVRQVDCARDRVGVDAAPYRAATSGFSPRSSRARPQSNLGRMRTWPLWPSSTASFLDGRRGVPLIRSAGRESCYERCATIRPLRAGVR